MQRKHNPQTETMPLPGRLVIAVGLTLILLLIGSSAGFAQEDPTIAGQVRTIEPDELGITNPAGLAFSTEANVFYVVRGSDAAWSPAPFSDIAVLSASPVINQVGTVRVPAAIPDPINMAFDGKASRLLVYQPGSMELVDIAAGSDGQLDSTTLTRHRVPRLGLRSPQGMTVDPASGQIYFLDSIGPRIVRIEPDADGGFDGAVISQLDLVDINLTGLRGLVFNPANGHLYTLNPARQTLYELTQGGRIVASHDISSLALGDAQGLVFAPSGDLTDDPSSTSLYIADSGPAAGLDQLAAPAAGGQIVEFSFTELEPLAVTWSIVAASLVQTIDTSAFHPPSPDPAGIVYIESLGVDTLLMSDSEVDEMPMYFTGDNIFEMTLGGSLRRTGTSLPDSYEPSGLAYDPDNEILFLADDNTKRVWMIEPGDDGLFFTDDDPLATYFSTLAFGCGDAEGIAFDTWTGALWLASGDDKEVFRVEPGTGGFGTGDEVVTSWDTSGYAAGPGGLAFDPENGYLYLIGRPRGKIFHLKLDATDTLIVAREINISAVNPTLPAGATLAPGSLDPGVMNLYVVDRGIDNNNDPLENDGKVYEFYVPPLTADVALTKSVEPVVASPGDTITYTLSFRNIGASTANGVVITDIIPSEVTVQSVYSSGVYIENSGESPPYVWLVQDLTTTDEGLIVVTGEVSPALSCFDPFTNTATIATESADARSRNDSGSVTVAAGAGVTVEAVNDSLPADPGTEIVYSLWVTNTGACADTFDVSVSGTDWTVSVTDTVGELGPGLGASVAVTVTVPADAPCGPESATITFTSQGASNISASSELVTDVNPAYGVKVAPPTDALTGLPSDVLTYTLRMTNTGNCLETFDVSASEPNWITEFPLTVGPLYRGLGLDVEVVATVPPDALITDQDVVTMTFASHSNSVISATSILTTSVGVSYGVEVEPATASRFGDPSTGVTYTLQVTNTGNYTDTFTVSTSSDSWPVSAQPTVVTLDPHLSAAVVVTVTVPLNALCDDENHTTVTFTSESSATISASSFLTTSANAVRKVKALTTGLTGSGNPDSEVYYDLLVQNKGNCTDILDISVSGTTWPVSTTVTAVELPPGDPASVGVTVTVPLTARCGVDVATVTFTSRNDSLAFDSSTLATTANAISEFTLTPSVSTSSGDLGYYATHSLWLTNTGNCEDTFTFSAAGDEWPASTLSPTVTLDPDHGAPISVTVALPSGAQCSDSDVATVTYTAENEATVSASSTLTTTVNAFSALTLVPSTDIRSASPGSEAVYSLWLTNTGICTDTFTVAAVGDMWLTSAQPTLLELEPEVGASIAVTVAVPSGTQCGTDVATVTGTSFDGTASATSTLTTTATAVRGLTVEPPSEALSGNPGDPVVYSLSVTNTGNCTDTFAFAASGNAWTTSAPPVGPVDPGASANVAVTVTVHPDALCNEQDIVTATFTSVDGTTSSSSVLTTTANTISGVMVEPPSAAHSGDPGTGVTYTLWVTNAGNCSDTLLRSTSGNLWSVDASTSLGPLNPDEGESITATVSVPIDTLGGVSDAATVTFASQHDGTVADSTTLTTTANSVAPVASDDPYDATEDVPLVVTAPGVLDNDDDANGETLTVTQYTQPANGTVVLDPDGSFTYTPTHNFDGVDTFAYHASDGVLTDTATVTITVADAGDNPIVNAGPDQPGEGEPPIEEGDTVSFSGDFVDPPRQSLLAGESIHWDFGDGGTVTGTLTPIHTYVDDDEYTVTLTITDTEGDVGQDSLLVTVLNVPPTVDAGPDQSAVPGELLGFSGSFSDPAKQYDTYTIQWDLDDGTTIHGITSFNHAYDAVGTYTVTLTVADDDGGVGTDSAIVTVRHKVYLPLILRKSGP